MKLNRIELKNYRNIAEMILEPCGGVNVIYGENAQGKTNMLEAIWLLTGLKSFRGAKDRELVNFGADFARIKAVYETAARENKIEITVMNKRETLLNGVKTARADIMGKFGAVVFSPDFLSIVKDGPEERRKFIDSAICRINSKYAAALIDYSRLLKQRNSLLKDVQYSSELFDLLDVVDQRLSASGEEIVKYRKNYTEEITPFVKSIYSGISSGKEEITVEYKKTLCENGESLIDVIKARRREDIINKVTSAGPHRDDIDIKINGISARMYCSQGQARSCALALKMGEASIIKEHTLEQPVALLDDVMSELDLGRQDYILNHIKDWQVFITCCDPAPVLRLCSGMTVNISEGKIIKCT